jgi:hypothetical protein
MSDSGVIFTAAAPAFQTELAPGLSAARPAQGSRRQKVPNRRGPQAILDFNLRAFMVGSGWANGARRISVPFQDRLPARDLEQ